MKRILLVLILLCFACNTNDELKVYNYDGIAPLINKTDDKVHVVNFWATWCAPCVKELPYFEKINKGLKDLTTLTDIVSQIRGNISRAESDLGDAHSNVNNLEGQLKDSVQTLKKELKK